LCDRVAGKVKFLKIRGGLDLAPGHVYLYLIPWMSFDLNDSNELTGDF
jgi:hypothetical protein